MNLEEIKEAIDKGYSVYWKSNIYKVIKDSNNEYLILCVPNNSVIGLTYKNNITLNGDEKDFHYTRD